MSVDPELDKTKTLPSGAGAADRIGKYHLLQKLGEGGMGVVYLAEQTGPVRRQVALKVIKLGMDTSDVVARFETERQALAVMDHPNIAKVYDAGATENGRPYFVMELVRGIPLTEYCDQHTLSLRERLDLFIPICEAVQHAHQKGLIHRDLKPSNILVTVQEDHGLPKIIDFGVAKATGLRLTDKTLFTSQGQIIGTLEYMSPEQAELTGLDIDTRSDIYALGVVLYQLLVGELPFDSRVLRSAGLAEMQKIIREKDPPRPSARLDGDEAGAADVARRRGTDPRSMRRRLRGDLDWIVMKALEKDRRRRYPTAIDFAVDIGRFLRNEAVSARPPSAVYRLSKFARRNRLGIAFAAMLALALLAGAVGTGVGLVRARSQAAKTAALNRILKEMLSSVSPEKAQGREVTVRQMLDQEASSIGQSFPGAPEIEAQVRETIGSTYSALGRYEQAEPHLARAVEIFDQTLGATATPAREALNQRAVNQFKWDHIEEAEREWKQLLELGDNRQGHEDAQTLTIMHNLAALELKQKRYTEAEALLVRALDGRRRVLNPEDPQLTATMGNLAQLYLGTGRPEQAEPLLVQALEIRRRTLPPKHPRTLVSVCNLGEYYLQTGRYGEAEPLFREALEGFRAVYEPNHRDTLEALEGLSSTLVRELKFKEAEKFAVENFQGRVARYGEGKPEISTAAKLLADLYEAWGRPEQAQIWRASLGTQARGGAALNPRPGKGQSHP